MLKKGKKLKPTREWWASLRKGVTRTFPHRHKSKENWERAWFYVSNFMQERRQYEAHLEALPKRFSKRAYRENEYKIDVQNVLDHYTKWEREDFWDAKKSLKRTKQYEKREGLRPFHELLEEKRKATTRIKDQERENLHYLASRKVVSLV